MKKKLNHSRYLDYGAKDTGDFAYYRAKQTPTAKQIKFYKRLYALCKENNIDTKTGEYTKTRVDYAQAIDKLLERLKENGIDTYSSSDKEVSFVISHGTDHAGRYYTSERIVIKEGGK
jgi:hypothetical protein